LADIWSISYQSFSRNNRDEERILRKKTKPNTKSKAESKTSNQPNQFGKFKKFGQKIVNVFAESIQLI